MAKLVVLYNPPKDPQAFADYYASRHTPLAKKIPGLRALEVSTGPIGTPQGPAPYHLVAILTFDSMADLQAGLASPEGRETAADLANFASGGVSMLIYDHQSV